MKSDAQIQFKLIPFKALAVIKAESELLHFIVVCDFWTDPTDLYSS